MLPLHKAGPASSPHPLRLSYGGCDGHAVAGVPQLLAPHAELQGTLAAGGSLANPRGRGRLLTLEEPQEPAATVRNRVRVGGKERVRVGGKGGVRE